ncbi:carbohydrate-binding module family 52 protein [Thozetella sp. PMI_491]|nr:carbohydrate-binding module family 52 protein [Thozetella sp. PMI_491]
MSRSSLMAMVTAVVGLGRLVLGAQCGDAFYDPTQYVCWNNNFLCPVIAGEGLSPCSGACYSKFMYTCTNNAVTLLPAVASNTPFTLTAWNPTLPIHGAPVTAAGLRLVINGTTASYCPSQVGSACPPGTITALVASGGAAAMDVEVPGGQAVYLDPYWDVGYTQAHSASIPSGSLTSGFGAYQGGGFVNLNGNGWGWVACPPTAAGGGGPAWNLVGKNDTNAARLNGCTAVNLQINTLPTGTIGAWQYT